MPLAAIDETSKASAAEFFAADVEIPGSNDGRIIIVIKSSLAIVLEMTVDSGVTWAALNDGEMLAANRWYELSAQVTGTDKVNFRQQNGTATVTCRVHR